MKLIADYKKDVSTRKHQPGGYEWWYFDGIDDEGVYSFVIIFYEGNPFSTRYIKQLKKRTLSDEAYPKEHPAISISIYKDQKPIYYSFTEFDRSETAFDNLRPRIRVGNHSMEATADSDTLQYRINLKEKLPSGDKIVGYLEFESPVSGALSLERNESGHTFGHVWNLVQPRAEVTGELKIYARTEEVKEISFKGTGYHDHNTGQEPMRNEFREWYWGRFHFELGTLIYYRMERKDELQQQGWLISPDNGEVLQQFRNIQLEDESLTLFGMKTARKIMLSNKGAHLTIQQARIMDNGPFYQRFNSDAFINIPDEDLVQVAEGITEYIHPDRIYWRLFWPFINMRIRYDGESPHWVQRVKTLYRWTW